jgi:hypothetical protein
VLIRESAEKTNRRGAEGVEFEEIKEKTLRSLWLCGEIALFQ